MKYKNILGYTFYIPIFMVTYLLISGLLYWVFIDVVFGNEDMKTEQLLINSLYYWQISSGLVGGVVGLLCACNILQANKKLLSTILLAMICLVCVYLIYFNASIQQYDRVAGYISLLTGSVIGWGWANDISFKAKTD